MVLGEHACRVASSPPISSEALASSPAGVGHTGAQETGGARLSHRVWNAAGSCGWWLVFHHLLLTGHLLCPAAVLSQGDTTANKTSPCSWSRRWGLGAGGRMTKKIDGKIYMCKCVYV